MASTRVVLACALLATLAGCRSEVPRQYQSLKDYAAPPPAPPAAKPAAATPPAPTPAIAAPAPVAPPATTGTLPEAPTPAVASPKAEAEPDGDRLAAWCWDRYRQHLDGKRPETLEEKESADSTCRLVICPNCKQ
jgi:uncharacterized lipoprotein